MKTTKYLLVVILFFVFITTFAQDGTLDTAYGIKKNTFISPPFPGSQINDFIVDSQGNSVVSGEAFDYSGNNQNFMIKRDTNGALVSSFGNKGMVMDSITFGKMLFQADGKIISVGDNSELIRYNIKGALDTTFGVSGIVNFPNSHINTFMIQTDGKIIVSEKLSSDSGTTIRLVRLLVNGSLDTGFGVNGTVMVAVGNLFDSYSGLNISGLDLQADGKILLSGIAITADNKSDIVLIRCDIQGVLDINFNTKGFVLFDFDDNDEIQSLKIQNDRKILLSTSSDHFTSNAVPAGLVYNLIRLLPDGTKDVSFGVNGMSKLPFQPKSTVLQADGKIVVIGLNEYIQVTGSGNFTLDQMGLVRYVNDGTLDSTFGNAGIVLTPNVDIMGFEGSVLNCIGALQADGKIMVTAETCEAHLSCHHSTFVFRYNSSQSLSNATFGIPQNSFTVYPNPINQFINVDFNLAQSEVLSMDLYDINGRMISNLLSNANFLTGNNSQKLELPESLSRGIYLLNISDGKNTSTVKIVK